METLNEIFTENMEYNSLETILNKVKNGEWSDILKCICSINKNSLVLNFFYFKHIIKEELIYDSILNYLTNTIDSLLEKTNKITVHLNIKNLSLSDIDKHKNFFQNISSILKAKYPEKLSKCYIYNCSFIFAQFSSIINMFLDKDTQKKIEIVKHIKH